MRINEKMEESLEQKMRYMIEDCYTALSRLNFHYKLNQKSFDVLGNDAKFRDYCIESMIINIFYLMDDVKKIDAMKEESDDTDSNSSDD